MLTVRSDRRAHPPYGIEGGEAGAPSSNTIRSADGEERSVATMPMEALQLRRGDVFHHVSAGGGGSGPAFERDPALVLEDVLDEKVSVEAARERYGVVIADGTVDERRDRRGARVSFDLVIRGGTVYDGTGAEGRVADVGVKDGRIAAIGSLEPNGQEVDAAGLAVAPGFIDIHSHSDYTLLVDPRAVSAIHQGVTTEVVGNCGFGCFPIRDPQQARARDLRLLRRPPDHVELGGRVLRAARGGAAGGQRAQPRPERAAAAGDARPRRPAGRRRPSSAEMQVLLRESLDHGAWGYSTGLEYAQEQAAGEEELTALARDGAASTRRTRASATTAPPTRSRRRSAPARRPRSGSRSRISCRATGSRRAVAASSSSSRRATRARTSPSTCTRAPSG